MVVGHDVPGHGDGPARSRPPRCLAARPAHLRHLQRRPCRCVGARRGAGARHPDPDQRPADPQRAHRHAVRARPRHGALPGESPGLGGHERRRGGRSRGDVAARDGEQRLAELRLDLLPRRPGPPGCRRHVAAAGTVRLGVARPPGLPPDARAEPAPRGPHARGVRLAGRLRADPDAALGQGGPPADLPRGRDVPGAALGRPDGLEDAAASAGSGPQRARRAERRGHRPDARPRERCPHLRRPGLRARHRDAGRRLPGVGGPRERTGQLPRLRRVPAGRRRRGDAAATRRAAAGRQPAARRAGVRGRRGRDRRARLVRVRQRRRGAQAAVRGRDRPGVDRRDSARPTERRRQVHVDQGRPLRGAGHGDGRARAGARRRRQRPVGGPVRARPAADVGRDRAR